LGHSSRRRSRTQSPGSLYDGRRSSLDSGTVYRSRRQRGHRGGRYCPHWAISQTSWRAKFMSTLPPKADIGTQSRNVCFVPKADSCTAARSMSVMRTRTVAARMAATITNLLWNKGCDGSASRANKNRLYVRTDVRRLRRTTRFERNDPNDAQTRSCPRKQERALHRTADTY
jgi:hypothetical protein